MWLAWHLIASTSHTPKFLPFVCKLYIFSQGHIGEGQWEGRERRGDLLMHWPFQKEPCSPQEQSSVWTIPYSYGQSREGELSYPTTATGWAVISSGMYPGVLWPRKFWEHPWITNGVTRRPQGLRSWLAPKKSSCWALGLQTTTWFCLSQTSHEHWKEQGKQRGREPKVSTLQLWSIKQRKNCWYWTNGNYSVKCARTVIVLPNCNSKIIWSKPREKSKKRFHAPAQLSPCLSSDF